MKRISTILFISLALCCTNVQAQSLLSKVGEAAKKAAASAVKSAAESAINSVTKEVANATENATKAVNAATENAAKTVNDATANAANSVTNAISGSGSTENSGQVYYVSETGNNRADGLTPATAKRDIQKALSTIADANQNGAVIRIAKGNYLGYLDAGYIEISNFVTLEGGWDPEFKTRNPYEYISRIQTTKAQDGTNGDKALITISGLDNTDYTVGGTLVIDGLMLDLGLQNNYYPYDPADSKTGSPEGVSTGRLKDGTQDQLGHQLMHSDAAIAGNLIVRNCLFLNGQYFGIQINTRCGQIEIYDNVFICNRYSAVRIDGWDKEGYRSKVDFHHNTVGFSWCRDKMMEDMGYGYEFMNKVSGDVHHNVFLCNNFSAIARTRSLSGPDEVIEAKKVVNVFENYFFMNAADIQLASAGGGKWTNVMVNRFDDIDEKLIKDISGNKDLPADDPLISCLWETYLKGFANLEVIEASSSFNPNSGANLYRQAHGMNMTGTEVQRVSMFGNRYDFDQAMKLFGAKSGYGAQKQSF